MGRLAAKMAELKPPPRLEWNDANLLALLKKHRATTEEIAKRFSKTERQVLKAMGELGERGHMVYLLGRHWTFSDKPAPKLDGEQVSFKTDKQHKFKVGLSSDQHLCSKYERLDVLNDLYDKFAARGVSVVLNAGNWIDGEARFNRHDLHTHGMDAQVDYLIENYPQREGITTYAVAGDDHEGWYSQAFGIDIGKHVERKMREVGRKDWVDLGYMEAFTPLVNRESGKVSQLLTIHPGGGSAYAVSYQPQKLVESFQGGEKPGALFIGHYHKMSFNLIRGVFTFQCGATQDQTPFMRKKRIDAHVGGWVVELAQDPATGALVSCACECFQYFNRGYYNDRWSKSGGVVLPERSV